MTPEQRAWVRSPRGQMQLMLLVFAGSILFSIGCALVRTAFFERYVYEDFPELPARLVQLDANDAETIAALPTEDRYALYGAQIAADDPQPGALLDHPDELHDFVRGTLATGRPAQRHAATRMLVALKGHVDADALERSARYALRRATQSGDDEGARRATAVLDALGAS